jgi:hypothetical protein
LLAFWFLTAGLETAFFNLGFNPNCLAMDFPSARPAATPVVVFPREIPRRIGRPDKQEKYLVGVSSPAFLRGHDVHYISPRFRGAHRGEAIKRRRLAPRQMRFRNEPACFRRQHRAEQVDERRSENEESRDDGQIDYFR